MKNIIFIYLAFSTTAFAKAIEIKMNPPLWSDSIKQLNSETINICGDRKIQLTGSSLKKNFLFGKPHQGYFLSSLISYESYREILRTKNNAEGKETLKKVFASTQLWRVVDKKAKSLGVPKIIELPFSATVKDCVDGAKTTLGMDCSSFDKQVRESCCSEKFVGPIISWESEQGSYQLFYSPDPSVRLKIPNEKSHRYCHVVDSVSLIP